jgi:hypothetical protein
LGGGGGGGAPGQGGGGIMHGGGVPCMLFDTVGVHSGTRRGRICHPRQAYLDNSGAPQTETQIVCSLFLLKSS